MVNFLTDIASGMHHLAQARIVHRDVAARNILVDANLNCKISDFGLARDVYEDSMIYFEFYMLPTYIPIHSLLCLVLYSGAGRNLPWRWMSPEASRDNAFTTLSDVWAYGVTIWEIFNYGTTNKCRYKPLSTSKMSLKATFSDIIPQGDIWPYPQGIWQDVERGL